MSNEKQCEIFRADNGLVLETLYGRANAYGRAKGYARELNIDIGVTNEKGDTTYYKPTVAAAWLMKERAKNAVSDLFWILDRITDDLTSEERTVRDEYLRFAKNLLDEIKG